MAVEAVLDDGEPEPGAGTDMIALLHAVELVEHALKLARRNAAAFVRDLEHHLVSHALAPDRDRGVG